MCFFEDEDFYAGGKLYLDVEEVALAVVDQQDLEEQVVFVDSHESLCVEGVEGTG